MSWLAVETKIRDQSVETENSSRRIRLDKLMCGRKTEEKTRVQEAKRKSSTAHLELKETIFLFQPKL
jgi:hypothetical protein